MPIKDQQTQERANVLRQQAETINVLVHLGYNKFQVVRAVTRGDLSTLSAD